MKRSTVVRASEVDMILYEFHSCINPVTLVVSTYATGTHKSTLIFYTFLMFNGNVGSLELLPPV